MNWGRFATRRASLNSIVSLRHLEENERSGSRSSTARHVKPSLSSVTWLLSAEHIASNDKCPAPFPPHYLTRTGIVLYQSHARARVLDVRDTLSQVPKDPPSSSYRPHRTATSSFSHFRALQRRRVNLFWARLRCKRGGVLAHALSDDVAMPAPISLCGARRQLRLRLRLRHAARIIECPSPAPAPSLRLHAFPRPPGHKAFRPGTATAFLCTHPIKLLSPRLPFSTGRPKWMHVCLGPVTSQG